MKYVAPLTLFLVFLSSCVNTHSEKQELLFIREATLLAVDGGRRGWFYPEAGPSPDFFLSYCSSNNL